jgi:AcrR family transcriptional regulator
MRLFAERGYGNVTVADVAEAAEVSRATVFAYYPAKEDLVLGEAPAAIEALSAALAGLDDGRAVIEAVRGWLRTLAGWMEPELLVQVELAEQVPAVGAARSRVLREIEGVIAEALARSMGAGADLAANLVAGSLASALLAVEQEAVRRMRSSESALPDEEIDALLDDAVAFVDGGLARLGVDVS